MQSYHNFVCDASSILPAYGSSKAVVPGPAYRASSIPLPSSHVARTLSEVQLSADQAAAEQRDNRMFYRLINGIRDRHQTASHYYDVHPEGQHFIRTDMSIARIFRARRAVLDTSTANIILHDDIFSTSGDAQQQQQVMWNHSLTRAAGRASESSATDGWSITGFDGDDRQHGMRLHQDDSVEEDDDEGIFALDL